MRGWGFLASLFVAIQFSFVQADDIVPVFNQPGLNGLSASTTVEEKLVELIQAADPYSTIHVAMYTFFRPRIAVELIKAHKRGVKVQLVVDDKNLKRRSPGEPMDILKNGIDGLPGLSGCGPKGCVTYCRSGCNSLNIHHNKFFLFSKVGKDRHIVVQTSANLTEGQNRNYNDLVIIKNDLALYQGLLNYWNDLAENDGRLKMDNKIKGQKATVYIFPRLSDPILSQLADVNCKLEGSTVRVIQSRFDDYRLAIARRLAELARQGCDVQVIVRNEPEQSSPGRQVASVLKDHLVILPYSGGEDSANVSNSVHSKVVLISASIKGSKEKRNVIMTGSHNLNITSRYFNDELLFVIENKDLLLSYSNYFDEILSEYNSLKSSQMVELN